jgi:multidrug transporter EmrE-like cation transporter
MLGCLLTPCTATVLQPVWPKGLSAWLFDLKYIPLGLAYAIWSGLGTVGWVLLGLLIWNEILGPVHIFAIALIVGGVVVLNVVPSY